MLKGSKQSMEASNGLEKLYIGPICLKSYEIIRNLLQYYISSYKHLYSYYLYRIWGGLIV